MRRTLLPKAETAAALAVRSRWRMMPVVVSLVVVALVALLLLVVLARVD